MAVRTGSFSLAACAVWPGLPSPHFPADLSCLQCCSVTATDLDNASLKKIFFLATVRIVAETCTSTHFVLYYLLSLISQKNWNIKGHGVLLMSFKMTAYFSLASQPYKDSTDGSSPKIPNKILIVYTERHKLVTLKHGNLFVKFRKGESETLLMHSEFE